MAVAAVSAVARRGRPPSRDSFRPLTAVEQDIVTINTGGKIFQTFEKTLNRFPNTLLGCPEKRTKYYDPVKKQYFFDRHRGAFTAILYYYQSGLLEQPLHVPTNVFQEEVSFFQLNEQQQQQNNEEAVDRKQSDNPVITIDIADLPNNVVARKIYLLFENPDSSKGARFLAIFSLMIIILSIMVFCAETLPQFEHNKSAKDVFFGLNAACSSWFTMEYVLRLLVAPNKLRFVRGFLNVLDLLSILPFYVTLAVKGEKAGGIALLRVMRVIRVCRIFKLTRHSKGLNILGKTLASSLNELLMLSLFLVIGVIVFASAAYYAEDGAKGFRSIPEAFWWAVVTMTTVGYGNVVPKTTIGQCIGAVCALAGVLAIALPVPVIVSNFEKFYNIEVGNQSQVELLVAPSHQDLLVVKSPYLERRSRARSSPTPEVLRMLELPAQPVHLKNGAMKLPHEVGRKRSRTASPIPRYLEHEICPNRF